MQAYRGAARIGALEQVVQAPEPSDFSLSYSIHVSPSLQAEISDLFLFIEAPELDGSQLPDGETLIYTLVECSDIQLTDVRASTVMGKQTGNEGKGADAIVFAVRPKNPLCPQLFWGLRLDASSGANATVANKFGDKPRFALRVALT